jgi:CRISPR-associated endonuclease/helicase Cas3
VLSQRLTGETIDSPTNAAAIYQLAEKRGFFVREDWRRLQPYFINLLHSSRMTGSPFSGYLQPAFDDDCGMFLWTGKYLAGLDGVGIKEFGPEDYTI